MLKKIFKIISFYDEARWASISNYNLINFYKNNLNDDVKLITHWLCYITDRQMAFERIWDIGGFVFSELTDQFKESGDLELLNPNNPNSFLKKNEKAGYIFKSKSRVNGNTILKRSYKYKEDETVKFTSRYYPSDYFSILYTLDILKRYNFSLTKFIVEQLNNHQEKDDFLRRILFSLYLLTYFEIGQPKKTDIENFQKNIKKAEERTKKVLHILNCKFEDEYRKFKTETIFNQKRAWCSLRDFIKSPEFSENFKKMLIEENVPTEQQKKLFSLESLRQFELPGDVWNNNSKFRDCILEETEYKNKKMSLNKILRIFYDKNIDGLGNCYPEQFDITFDFVPRMCEKNNCDICPIGFLKRKGKSNFEKICINNKKKYCSVLLTNCNYKINCFDYSALIN